MKTKRATEPTVLLLADSHDFTTDYVALELRRRDVRYARLDRDLMHGYSMTWRVSTGEVMIERSVDVISITAGVLKSILYRAPTYLRETGAPLVGEAEQLRRSQWMSFFRNLESFEGTKWVNRPSSTFRAENKILQLLHAKAVGFDIPETIVANTAAHVPVSDKIIVKALDTILITAGEREKFAYTSILSSAELVRAELALAPVIVQQLLSPKVDLRVTVIERAVFCVSILLGGEPIEGDWRKKKREVQFVQHALPREVADRCVALVASLGLAYGAIDLAICHDKYYFIEINPTGEWAWLVDNPGLPIDQELCNCLLS